MEHFSIILGANWHQRESFSLDLKIPQFQSPYVPHNMSNSLTPMCR